MKILTNKKAEKKSYLVVMGTGGYRNKKFNFFFLIWECMCISGKILKIFKTKTNKIKLPIYTIPK